MKILLVEPAFPKPCKSKNHNDFLPLGLLKLASYHRKKGDIICLVRGDVPKEDLIFEHPNGIQAKCSEPDKILITSYFTYWSLYVKRSVSFYRNQFPKKKIIVGGIYASLMPEHCKKYTGCDEVFIGIHPEAEAVPISYKYLEKHFGPIDYQIIHTSRGCIRKCGFCGVYIIEPEFQYKTTIKKEIVKRKIIFYDNNLLANPHIEEILTELAYLKEKQKILWCEAQSGIDGRLLEKNPDLAYLLKKAAFKNIRISWDGDLKDAPHIKKQIKLLKKVGYNLRRNVFIFMIYNWDLSFDIMEQKRLKCWDWKVQVLDCRYRPLKQTYDRYKGQKFRTGQNGRDYHIHKESGWTDHKIRTFRKHIRRQNICVRLRIQFYSKEIEKRFLNKYVRDGLINLAKKYSQDIEEILNSLKIQYWFPENYNGNGHQVSEHDIFEEYERFTNNPAIYKNKVSPKFIRWRNEIQRNVFQSLKWI